jgi:hypothetical protein
MKINSLFLLLLVQSLQLQCAGKSLSVIPITSLQYDLVRAIKNQNMNETLRVLEQIKQSPTTDTINAYMAAEKAIVQILADHTKKNRAAGFFADFMQSDWNTLKYFIESARTNRAYFSEESFAKLIKKNAIQLINDKWPPFKLDKELVQKTQKKVFVLATLESNLQSRLDTMFEIAADSLEWFNTKIVEAYEYNISIQKYYQRSIVDVEQRKADYDLLKKMERSSKQAQAIMHTIYDIEETVFPESAPILLTLPKIKKEIEIEKVFDKK